MIEQLRAMIAGRGDGIDLDTPVHWAVEGLKQPAPFFEHLPSLLPSGSILYIEGTNIASDVAALYLAHRAGNAVDVARDTIAPVPDIYHFTFSAEVSARLRQFAGSHSVAELFDHLKAYQGETVLFAFHDAFDGTLRISDHIPEANVAQFCQALGVSCRREETGRRDPDQLRKVLWSLEHPDQARLPTEGGSGFSRAWRRLTGR
jgi:hypothetical protein